MTRVVEQAVEGRIRIAGTTILIFAGVVALIGLLLIPLPGPGVLLIMAAVPFVLTGWFFVYLGRSGPRA